MKRIKIIWCCLKCKYEASNKTQVSNHIGYHILLNEEYESKQ